MARPLTAPVSPNRCRRERPGCGDMVYPLSDKRWRDSTRRRSLLGVPVLVAEESQAGLEAASSTWCGGSIAPFVLGAKQLQPHRCAGATHPASLCGSAPRTALIHTTAGRTCCTPKMFVRVPPTVPCVERKGGLVLRTYMDAISTTQGETDPSIDPLRWCVLWYALFSDTSRLPR